MKKILSTCLTFALLFTCCIGLMACGKKDDTKNAKITFDKGAYTCTLDAESVVFVASAEDKATYLEEYGPTESDAVSEIKSTLDLSTVTFYDYSLDLELYNCQQIASDSLVGTIMKFKIKDYTFKNNTLTFGMEGADNVIEIRKTEENALVGEYIETYDFSEEENVSDYRNIFTATIILNKVTDENPKKQLIEDDEFLNGAFVSQEYECTSTSVDWGSATPNYDSYATFGITNDDKLLDFFVGPKSSLKIAILSNNKLLIYTSALYYTGFQEFGADTEISIVLQYPYSLSGNDVVVHMEDGESGEPITMYAGSVDPETGILTISVANLTPTINMEFTPIVND